MKKILIIGNANSVQIINLVAELKKQEKQIIDIFTTHEHIKENSVFDNVFEPKSYFYYKRVIGVFCRLPWFISVCFFLLTNPRKNYDSIHIHYLDLLHSGTISIYKKLASKIVAITWGSDLFKCKDWSKLTRILENSDVINVSTSEMKNTILKRLPTTACKMKQNRFGLKGLDYINLIRSNRSNNFTSWSKHKSIKKPILVIGTNASENQNHLKIIESLKEFYEHYHFVIPMTYGGTQDYINKVKSAMSITNSDYEIIDTFLDDNTLAELRLCSKVLIQMQNTDALSGAMQEHIYAGSIVITAEWLNYTILDEIGIDLLKVESFKDLNHVLNTISCGNYEIDFNKNSKLIYEMSSFKSVINGWNNL
ncbi:hypothetical protein [Shewanella algae]|uniref:hypothetical protein n=1 Tax=Shewanella algae TaxID=38313 RepID=UPI003005B57C